MKRTHLAIQLAIVLTATASVGWPQFRPVRRVRACGSTHPMHRDRRRRTSSRAPTAIPLAKPLSVLAARLTGPRSRSHNPGPSPGVAEGLARKYNTPIAVAAVGGKFNALVGVAQTSLNMPIPYARVVARNIHTGRIEARATANDVGRFSFLDLDPELLRRRTAGPRRLRCRGKRGGSSRARRCPPDDGPHNRGGPRRRRDIRQQADGNARGDDHCRREQRRHADDLEPDPAGKPEQSDRRRLVVSNHV